MYDTNVSYRDIVNNIYIQRGHRGWYVCPVFSDSIPYLAVVSHFDHIYGLNEVLAAFPECLVYTSEYGGKALFDDRKNFSHYHESPISYKGPEPRILKEGDSVELFPDCMLQVMETPGHCPSCLTYIVGDCIFTGDAHIPGLKVVTNLPRGNRVKAEESLKKIFKLAENRTVCAGHKGGAGAGGLMNA